MPTPMPTPHRKPDKKRENVLFIPNVPQEVRARIALGAAGRGMTNAQYIIQLVALHDRLLMTIDDDIVASLLADLRLGPVTT